MSIASLESNHSATEPHKSIMIINICSLCVFALSKSALCYGMVIAVFVVVQRPVDRAAAGVGVCQYFHAAV